MIRRIINKIKTSIWLYPTIYSIGSLLLALAVALIDQRYSQFMAEHIHGIFYTTSSLAQTVLGIIAGAFISIATFTFSTAMIVLTMYSSQFTPRVVENFLNNQTTMKSFGVFLSGFIYAITSLLLINTSSEGKSVIAASVGVLYMIVGLIYFLLFIQNVSTHIQANGLILRLQEEAVARIRDYLGFVEKSEMISKKQLQEMIRQKKSVDINGISDGYIQEIDYDSLLKFSQNHHCMVCFEKVVGQFISTETRIMTLYQEKQETLDQEVIDEIQQCVWIGSKRTETQDFSFTIQKIVEIALKALSPGINDPHTAIHCLQIIGLLLRDLAETTDGYFVLKEEDESGFVVNEAYDFEIILYDAYHQIILYGQSDASVMVAVFKSLRFAKARASTENAKIINEYAQRLSIRLDGHTFDSLEQRKIDKEYSDLIALQISK